MIKECVICGKEFEAKGSTKACSPECKKKLRNYMQKHVGEILTPKTKQNNLQRENKTARAKSTLYWDCKKAVCGCSWSNALIPVEGWEAKDANIKVKGKCEGKAVIVLKCPEFDPEPKRKTKR